MKPAQSSDMTRERPALHPPSSSHPPSSPTPSSNLLSLDPPPPSSSYPLFPTSFYPPPPSSNPLPSPQPFPTRTHFPHTGLDDDPVRLSGPRTGVPEPSVGHLLEEGSSHSLRCGRLGYGAVRTRERTQWVLAAQTSRGGWGSSSLSVMLLSPSCSSVTFEFFTLSSSSHAFFLLFLSLLFSSIFSISLSPLFSFFLFSSLLSSCHLTLCFESIGVTD